MMGMACRWCWLGPCVLGAASVAICVAAQAASTVPLTFNGLIRNDVSGQSGWGGFGSFTYDGSDVGVPTTVGQYEAFEFDSLNSGGGDQGNGSGAGWNASPNNEAPFDQLAGLVLDVNANDYPVFDRAGYGVNFDPDLYKLEVVYKPMPTNEAPIFNITMDTYDGFHVEDRYLDEAQTMPYPFGFGQGKRQAEQQQWGFGYADVTGNGTTDDGMGGQRGLTIQEYYDANPKDADGFVTISAPLTDGIGGDGVVTPSEWWTFTGQSYLFASGDPNFFPINGYPGDEEPDFGDFENLIPNGVVQLHMQSAYIDDAENPNLGRLHLEVKRISVVPINPDPTEVARLDAMSGIGRRFGTPFSTQTSANGVDLDDNAFMHEGNLVVIRETDQLQRFDQNGFTNLIINTDDDDTLGGFGIWQDPQYQTFDGTQATLEVRAKLTAPLDASHASRFDVVLNDMDGNDTGPGDGGEEYKYYIDLNNFNTSTFTTLSIALSDYDDLNQAFEFVNSGDGLLSDFNLYYLGALTLQDAGLVDVELEYIRIVLPTQGLAGDYNGDHVVNAADYTVWRNHLGESDESSLNGNGDGLNGVDQGDYTRWKDNFGATAGSGASAGGTAAVPEPAACLLWLLAIGILTPNCRRRR